MKQILHFKWVLVFFALVLSFTGYSQCPSSISATTSNKKDADCPSNGAITINPIPASPGSGRQYYYNFIQKPNGYDVLRTTDNSFSSLTPGNYKVQITCEDIDGGNPSANTYTVDFTIANLYTPLNKPTGNITNTCKDYTPGGTITGTTSGGKAPLTWALIPSANTNIADNDPLVTYQSSGVFNPMVFQTYQLRVKDACGNYSTQPVSLTAGKSAANLVVDGTAAPADCAAGANAIQLNVYFVKDDNSNINMSDYPEGLKVKVYKDDGGCTKGAFLTEAVVKNSSLQIILPDKGNYRYYFETTTICGETKVTCDGSYANLASPSATFVTKVAGCDPTAVTGSNTLTITNTYATNVTYPVKVYIVKKPGTNPATDTVARATRNNYSSSCTFTGISDDFSYEGVVIDACGRIVKQDIVNPQKAGTPASITVDRADRGCTDGKWADGTNSNASLPPTSQDGTKTVGLYINGFIAGMGDPSSTVKIISGPSNVGVYGVYNNNGRYYWQNMLPGSYTLEVTTPCGTKPLSFNVDNGNVLQLPTVTATAVSTCGGTGTVMAVLSKAYNGSGTLYYTLVAEDGVTVIRNKQTTKAFDNLPAGKYKILMAVHALCGDAVPDIKYYSNAVEIIAAGAPPSIVKKVGVICEDGSGNLQPTGTMYLELAGGEPRKLFYGVKADVPANQTWTLVSNAVGATTTIENLLPNVTYAVQLISCGETALEEVSINKLAPLELSTKYSPCENAQYTLGVVPIPAAIYEWRNPANIKVSESPDYVISSYNTSYDGTYTCTVKLGDCVTRKKEVALKMTGSCDVILPVTLKYFKGVRSGENNVLSWEVADAKNVAFLNIEYSTNGTDFSVIAQVKVNNEAAQKYNYTHQGIQGNTYYRLRTVDVDGSFAYSNVVLLKDLSANDNFEIIKASPVPFKNNITVYYNAGTKEDVVVQLLSAQGATVKRMFVSLQRGTNNTFAVTELNQLPSGVYLLNVISSNGNHKVIRLVK